MYVMYMYICTSLLVHVKSRGLLSEICASAGWDLCFNYTVHIQMWGGNELTPQLAHSFPTHTCVRPDTCAYVHSCTSVVVRPSQK